MDAIILMDADSSLHQSCVCKAEDTEDGKGFVYDLEDATFKFDEKVQSIINTLEEEYGFNILHTVVFLEGHGNYRYGLNPDYKANRKDRERPPLLTPLREWVVDNYNGEAQPLSTFLSVNVETDDSVAATYKRYHLNDYGVQLIIASPDKDLKTIPNLLFDSYWSRMELSSVNELTAYRNLMIQMIMGDSADGVKGIPKMGKVKAEKALNPLNRKIDMTLKVYELYKLTFGVKAKQMFYKNYYSLKLNDSNIATPNIENYML